MKRPRSKKDSAQAWFEIDRGVLIGQVDALKKTIRKTPIELAMLSAESVFDKTLSARLDRKARALERMAERMELLGKTLARAKFPGAIESRGTAGKRRR